jgi:serine/threonine-protein phosphatase 2A regulatory subunit B
MISEVAGGWSFKQIIGDDNPNQQTSEEDLISAISFDQQGNHLAIGDNAGRVILFQRDQSKEGNPYSFLTELYAHTKFFDYFRSEDSEPRILDIKWVNTWGKSLNFLTATDKCINFCKVKERRKKIFEKVDNNSDDPQEYQLPKVTKEDKATWEHTIHRSYPKLHNYMINSLSVNPNGENFLSSDQCSIFMWHLEKSPKAFSLFESKISPEGEAEVITSSCFSPYKEALYLYSTSKGAVICDTRKHTAGGKGSVRFEEPLGKKNIFTDFLNVVSQGVFSAENRIMTRELLQVRIWDVRMGTRPLNIIPLNESLKGKLADMYENDSIQDLFGIAPSANGKKFVTGTYHRGFHIVDSDGENNMLFGLDYKKRTLCKKVPKNIMEHISDRYDFTTKTLKLAYHPHEDLVAIPLDSNIFIYSKPHYNS